MKSDVIWIDNHGNGFRGAAEEAGRIAKSCSLSRKNTIRLQLMTEEMLAMARSVTKEMTASFWIEYEGPVYDLHMTTRTWMNKEKRKKLINVSTAKRNEAAASFLGMLRDAYEQAMAVDTGRNEPGYEMAESHTEQIYSRYAHDAEWDRYEQSILRRLADEVKISIRGEVVEMIVRKDFSA